MGWIADPDGLDPAALPGLSPETIESLPTKFRGAGNVREWVAAAHPDVVFEATSLEPHTGQPAIDHIRAALQSGAHAITANKGPIVHACEELSALAREKQRHFLFESTVMDGVPLFSLFRECLPAIELKAFRGILNSTTNVILTAMEDGLSFEQALRRAQEVGVAETDASHDIDGWDATVKVAALVRVLMRVPIRLDEIERQGIRSLSAEQVRAARQSRTPYKLVCRARREGERVVASVRPEQLPSSDPLASVAGTSSIVYFETDMFPGLVITEVDPGLHATAYGMLSDFVRAVSAEPKLFPC